MRPYLKYYSNDITIIYNVINANNIELTVCKLMFPDLFPDNIDLFVLQIGSKYLHHILQHIMYLNLFLAFTMQFLGERFFRLAKFLRLDIN